MTFRFVTILYQGLYSMMFVVVLGAVLFQGMEGGPVPKEPPQHEDKAPKGALGDSGDVGLMGTHGPQGASGTSTPAATTALPRFILWEWVCIVEGPYDCKTWCKNCWSFVTDIEGTKVKVAGRDTWINASRCVPESELRLKSEPGGKGSQGRQDKEQTKKQPA